MYEPDGWWHLATRALDSGEVETARASFEQGADFAEKAEDFERAGACLHMAALCLARLGRKPDAHAWLERAIATKARAVPVDTNSIGMSLHLAGELFLAEGKLAAALGCYQSAVTAKRQGDRMGRVDPANVATSLHLAALCYVKLNRPADAIDCFDRAVSEGEKGDLSGRVDHQAVGWGLQLGGQCRAHLGHYAEAVEYLERAAAWKQRGPVDAESLGSCFGFLGDLHLRMEQPEPALRWSLRAAQVFEQGGAPPVERAEALSRVAACYQALDKIVEAAAWEGRATVMRTLGEMGER